MRTKEFFTASIQSSKVPISPSISLKKLLSLLHFHLQQSALNTIHMCVQISWVELVQENVGRTDNLAISTIAFHCQPIFANTIGYGYHQSESISTLSFILYAFKAKPFFSLQIGQTSLQRSLGKAKNNGLTLKLSLWAFKYRVEFNYFSLTDTCVHTCSRPRKVPLEASIKT